MRWRARRISVDLDEPTELRLLTTFFNARSIGEVEAMRTGHGYHLRIFKHCESIDKNINVRRHLADDVNRIGFDEERKISPVLHGWVDTVFRFKCKGGKGTGEEPVNILSLPFTSQLPAFKRR